MPHRSGNYIIVPLNPPKTKIKVIPPNRGSLLSIPNRQYVTVSRTRGGGGFKIDTPGKPGEIILNPFVVDVPKPKATKEIKPLNLYERVTANDRFRTTVEDPRDGSVRRQTDR